MNASCVLSIDIGGTKIAAGLVRPEAPTTVLGRTSCPTNAQAGGDAVAKALLGIVDQLLATARDEGLNPTAVGIGSPGVVDARAATVLSCGWTMPGWAGTNLAELVGGHTGLPVRAANDVRVMGLGEATHGAGVGLSRLMFFSLGTGLGGALIDDGKLPMTSHSTCGEIPYIFAPDIFGGCDMVENVGAGTGIARSYRKMAGIDDESMTLREIMVRYHDGEKLARQVVTESMLCTGRALAGFVNGVDCDAIILGGGVVSIGEPIIAPLTEGFRQHLLPGLQEVPIMRASLGLDAPLVGGAVLAGLDL